MSSNHDDTKEEYDDAIESEKDTRMTDTGRSEEKEKNHGDSATMSSAASSMHEGQHEDHDLEAIATVSTNSPPYSVFSKKQKYFIVCKSMSSCSHQPYRVGPKLLQSWRLGEASSHLSARTYISPP
jgi:hypothetical protein